MSFGCLYATIVKSVVCSGDGLIGVEVSLVLPHRPAAACELVGERDGGLVVPDPMFELHRPSLKPVERLMCFIERFGAGENGASPMDEQCSQIFIPLLGDSPEVSTLTGAVLPRGDTEP